MYSALVLLDNQKRMMYYLMVLVLLFLAELFYFRVADRCNIIDKPNERSSHTKVTLRGGGIIFYFGALVYFLTSDFEYPWFLLALTLVTFISFVDDIKSTGQMTRLLFHFSAMALMFYQWGLFSLSWWWIVIALIVCTGIINAYNFMDGINGITGGCSLVILAALAYINMRWLLLWKRISSIPLSVPFLSSASSISASVPNALPVMWVR